jgi:Na+/proline symporter
LSMALSIASLINGPILGVFLVGTLLRRVSQPAALIGMLVSLFSMVAVFLTTKIAWTWYAFLGSLITFVVAWAASFAFTGLHDSTHLHVNPENPEILSSDDRIA